jgi:hypothetical protein
MRAKAKGKEIYTSGDTKKARRGFLLQFVQFVQKRGSVSREDLQAHFCGRQVYGKRITAARVARYCHWCLNHGVLKTK